MASGLKSSTEVLLGGEAAVGAIIVQPSGPCLKIGPSLFGLPSASPTGCELEAGKPPQEMGPRKPQSATWGEAESEGVEWDMGCDVSEPYADKTGPSPTAAAGTGALHGLACPLGKDDKGKR